MSEPRNEPRTHPLNVGYLVVGLIFLGIAGSWALRAADVVDTGSMRWLVPVVLVVAGVIGLVAFTARGVSRGRPARVEEPPPYDPYRATTPEHDTPNDDELTLPYERGDEGDLR